MKKFMKRGSLLLRRRSTGNSSAATSTASLSSFEEGVSNGIELLMILTVDIGDGRTGEIKVHRDDSVDALAEMFCLEYGLNPDLKLAVAQHVQNQLDDRRIVLKKKPEPLFELDSLVMKQELNEIEKLAMSPLPKREKPPVERSDLQAVKDLITKMKESQIRGRHYVGERDNDGKMNGKGTYYFASGNRYTGDWKSGFMHGTGSYYFANGDKYLGEFQYDLKDGEGAFLYSNGDQFVGRWSNDRRVGLGTYIYAASKQSVEVVYNDQGQLLGAAE